MEMCYDGTLVMPSSYAVMSEDEMTYVEGGKSYSGVTGWAFATVLTATGAGMSKFAGETIKASLPYVMAMLATGSTGWLCAAVVASIGCVGLGALVYLGGQLSSAGLQALYYMGTKGRFTISVSNNIFSLLNFPS